MPSFAAGVPYAPAAARQYKTFARPLLGLTALTQVSPLARRGPAPSLRCAASRRPTRLIPVRGPPPPKLFSLVGLESLFARIY